MKEPHHERRRNRPSDRRAAIEQRHGDAALLGRKPFGDRFGRAGPVRRLAGAQQKPKRAKAPEAAGQRCQHGHHRIPRHRKAQTAPRAQHVDQAAPDELHDGIRDAKRDDDPREVAVGPVVFGLQVGCQHVERLAIDVIDDGGGKKQPSDPPAQIGDNESRYEWFVRYCHFRLPGPLFRHRHGRTERRCNRRTPLFGALP